MIATDAYLTDNAWLAAILRSTNDAIITTDVGGIILSCNEPAERLFGYGAAEVVGKPIVVLFPEDQTCEPPSATAGRRDFVDRQEMVGRREDGEIVDLSMKMACVRDGHGVIIGMAHILISQLEAHGRNSRLQEPRTEPVDEQRLIEVERAVSALVHEVSGSLTAITNYANACRALTKAAGQERLHAALERITDHASRAWRTTQRLRDVIRGDDIRYAKEKPPTA